MTKTEFLAAGKSLELHRYPPARDQNLQAWDAADEYLIEHLLQHVSVDENTSIVILNDEFGALSCRLADYSPIVVTDSWMSQCAILQNFERNSISTHPAIISPFAITDITPPIDIVLIKVPKTLALLKFQLIALQRVINPQTRVVAAAKVTHITKSVQRLFDQHIGPTKTSLAKKKARLVLSQPVANMSSANPFPSHVNDSDIKFVLMNHANVFSRERLDIGARFLLKHLPRDAHKVVDLGCGNGVLGVQYLLNNPQACLLFVDESKMAIASAKETAENAGVADRAEFYLSDSLKHIPDNYRGEIDLVLCNPPFHQKNAITDEIAWHMFTDAKRFLKQGGELRIVANRHLNYMAKMRKLFGGAKVIANNNKFNILSTFRRNK